ncbi:cysteine--tRNA ligase [Segnochrobactrum spirostomi]|uniref:Cysteine--tRNA ligase n=1 Tax=Segnochrobactrum spirostomi TaxID=2608987 RepID=A0A6A7Y4N8_9HYPH|nr:cysteine--tRNA ligase [Segnochrobactrum spirostomi]MQT14100.1 cysteine--tRNA ligase [Segnochrobactrum spirostomi]
MSVETGSPGLKLYNTLTREKEIFVPINPLNVRMYVCGPTVYDFAHIGNARPVIVFDLLYRLLRHLYGTDQVVYVRNVTDVDDKINARAAERGVSIRELTEATLAQYHADIDELGCLRPTHEPRATDYIRRSDGFMDMVTLIEMLIARGHAYVAEGHVLFHVPSMPDYGRLSRRPLDEMIAGARVDVAPYKRDPMDFVLWKPSKANEPAWESPWGPGRPGWHIECSAMSGALLGDVFDIHGGGIDLVFPHHENEIAQSRCAHGTGTLANVWMHNGFLMVEGEKMSKSLGNFVTIREALGDWPGPVVRLNMLKTHYRQPIDWTLKGLEETSRILARWGEAVAADPDAVSSPGEGVLEALCDDLNTPRAIAELYRSEDRPAELAASLRLIGFDPAALVPDASKAGVDEAFVAERIAARLAARRAKDFAEADRIRAELAAAGIVLKDTKDGTDWSVDPTMRGR